MLRMLPNGAITGHVVDEDREPMSSLQAGDALRYSQGRKQLASYGSATTNDIGEYRISAAARRYFITVSPRRSSMYGGPTAPRHRSRKRNMCPRIRGYRSGAAAPLEIGPGVVFRGADVALAKRRTVREGSRHRLRSESSRRRAMVFLTPRTGFSTTNRPVMLDERGNFDIRGIAPGRIRFWLRFRSRPLAARMPVEGLESGGQSEPDDQSRSPCRGRFGWMGRRRECLTAQVTLRPRDPAGLIAGPQR